VHRIAVAIFDDYMIGISSFFYGKNLGIERE